MPIELLRPHTKDLGGGFLVRRLLPALRRPAVGPFVFFDHFGPRTVQPDDAIDVRPHPHIGLATVTYLFDGAMQHHDSTGAFQRIEPGAINWMTAGRGVVHSERRPADLAGRAFAQHGLQLWVALPAELEDAEPSFQHVAAEQLPSVPVGAATVRVLVGCAWGQVSPAVPCSPTLFVDLLLPPGAMLDLPGPDAAAEQALYAVQGSVQLTIAGEAPTEVPEARLALLPADRACTVQAGPSGARAVLVGGAPLGHRHLWWNFVASDPARIERAAAAWDADAMGQVPGETERIPLPELRWRRG